MRIGFVEAASVVAIGIAAMQLQQPERTTPAAPGHAAVKPAVSIRSAFDAERIMLHPPPRRPEETHADLR